MILEAVWGEFLYVGHILSQSMNNLAKLSIPTAMSAYNHELLYKVNQILHGEPHRNVAKHLHEVMLARGIVFKLPLCFLEHLLL